MSTEQCSVCTSSLCTVHCAPITVCGAQSPQLTVSEAQKCAHRLRASTCWPAARALSYLRAFGHALLLLFVLFALFATRHLPLASQTGGKFALMDAPDWHALCNNDRGSKWPLEAAPRPAQLSIRPKLRISSEFAAKLEAKTPELSSGPLPAASGQPQLAIGRPLCLAALMSGHSSGCHSAERLCSVRRWRASGQLAPPEGHLLPSVVRELKSAEVWARVCKSARESIGKSVQRNVEKSVQRRVQTAHCPRLHLHLASTQARSMGPCWPLELRARN